MAKSFLAFFIFFAFQVDANEPGLATRHAPSTAECDAKFHFFASGGGEDLPYSKVGELVNADGVLPVAVKMSPETLLAAYKVGIFPYNFDEATGNVQWVSYANRGVLNFGPVEGQPSYKVPETLSKFFNREVLGVKFAQVYDKAAGKRHLVVQKAKDPIYQVTFDTAFQEVMLGCQSMERAETKTYYIKGVPHVVPNRDWIRPEFIENYTALYNQGYGHSVEVWDNKPEGKKLVGGIYGILVNGYFSAESTFRAKDYNYVSQFALIGLVQKLQSLGFKWMDTQVVTNMALGFGADTIPRADFQARLAHARVEHPHVQLGHWPSSFDLKPLR